VTLGRFPVRSSAIVVALKASDVAGDAIHHSGNIRPIWGRSDDGRPIFAGKVLVTSRAKLPLLRVARATC